MDSQNMVDKTESVAPPNLGVDKTSDERLWSIWERSKMARKQDKLWGHCEYHLPDGTVMWRQWWFGKFAIGWTKPAVIKP